MEQEIQQLKDRIDKLERALTLGGMSYDLKEIIRNEVIKGQDNITAVTRSLALSGAAESITLSVNPTGILVVNWKGQEYKLLYV